MNVTVDPNLMPRCTVTGRHCHLEQNVAGLGIGCMCETCTNWRMFSAPRLVSAVSLLDKVRTWLGR